jgi:hypothetical protein
MRLQLFALMALLCSAVHASYSESWQCGWKEGWRIERGDYFVPFPPFAPFPSLGHDSDQEGFAEGVLAGSEAARCQR